MKTFTFSDILARIRRFGQFSIGLAKETVIVREANDPLLRAERQEYLRGIQDGFVWDRDGQGCDVEGAEKA